MRDGNRKNDMNDNRKKDPEELSDEALTGEALTDGELTGVAGGERPAPKGDVWIPIHKAGG